MSRSLEGQFSFIRKKSTFLDTATVVEIMISFCINFATSGTTRVAGYGWSSLYLTAKNDRNYLDPLWHESWRNNPREIPFVYFATAEHRLVVISIITERRIYIRGTSIRNNFDDVAFSQSAFLSRINPPDWVN